MALSVSSPLRRCGYTPCGPWGRTGAATKKGQDVMGAARECALENRIAYLETRLGKYEGRVGAISCDQAENKMTDEDVFCAWKLGLSAYKTMRSLGGGITT